MGSFLKLIVPAGLALILVVLSHSHAGENGYVLQVEPGREGGIEVTLTDQADAHDVQMGSNTPAIVATSSADGDPVDCSLPENAHAGS